MAPVSLASVVSPSFTSPTPLDILTWNGSSWKPPNKNALHYHRFLLHFFKCLTVSWKLFFFKVVPRHTIFPSLGYSVSKYLGSSTWMGGEWNSRERWHMFLKCRLVTCYPSSWSAGHLAIFHIQKIPHGVTLNSRQIHFSHSSEGVTGSKCDANRLAAKVALAKLFLDLLLWKKFYRT